jgi:large subunit ribosomal protein L25
MNKELEAQVRLPKDKSHKQELLKNGFIPAVVYGKNMDSIAVSVNANALKKILSEAGANALIHLKIKQNEETKEHQVLLKSVQHEPVQRTLIHADFHEVSLKDKILATVTVHLTGIAPGVAKGGMLTQQLWKVEVECLAASIPETLMIDISGLDVGDGITLADLVLPPGVKVIGEGHAHVVSVIAQAAEVAAPVEEEEAAAAE